MKGRTDMLLALRTAFTKKYAYDFVFDRYVFSLLPFLWKITNIKITRKILLQTG